MRWTTGLADIARHVIGCQLSQETRVQDVLDDVASSIWLFGRPYRLEHAAHEADSEQAVERGIRLPPRRAAVALSRH